jgi:prophage regulatory protein
MDATAQLETILRKPEVLRATGLSHGQLYRFIAAGTFPRALKLGKKASGWRLSEVSAWINSRPRETAS